MRPKITTSRSLARSLSYNEAKVTQGKAECLMAANFLKDHTRLTFEDKLHCFKKRMALNERVRTSLHVTLNFDPADQLSNEQMRKIAETYMKEIGFERQPYIVYRHHDAGHPHCHIVTSHIRRDGSPIELYNIGRNQSEKAKELIEAQFKLTTAEMKKERRQQQQKINGVPRLIYGRGSIAQTMSNILEYVTNTYLYTSLKELNAVLRLFNMEAYRGKENSQLYQHRGLLYRALDDNGKYIGVPLKASFFDCKPTLDNLEQKFTANLTPKKELLMQATLGVLRAFFKTESLEEVKQQLTMHKIHMILHREKDQIKDVLYVNTNYKCVITGDELDQRANATAVQKLIDQQNSLSEEERQQLAQSQTRRYRLSQGF